MSESQAQTTRPLTMRIKSTKGKVPKNPERIPNKASVEGVWQLLAPGEQPGTTASNNQQLNIRSREFMPMDIPFSADDHY